MKNSQVYEKIFSRDFSLPSVEAWVRGESTTPKGWTSESQPFLPYIITERSDDTIHFYYDLNGISWVQDLLIRLARSDKNFIPLIEKTVLEKLSFINPIYEKEDSIDLPHLKRFLEELEAGYPWFEAMWWVFQMGDESKTAGLDLTCLAKIRAMTDKLCNSSDTVIRKSLINIFPKLGRLSSVLQTDEIYSGNIPQIDELEIRERGYFYVQNKLLVRSNKSEIEKQFGIHFADESIGKVRQLIGSPAYRGIVRGFVKKVMGHKQINEVKEGEIIISPMTIPDFIPAIAKAAAIVTDEGGVLSHAAIIAREFRKPTVVGTGIATKRLQDGDIVEVDATEGKVSLICHASIIANKLKKPCIVGTHFATDLFKDGDYVEVDADNGLITLLNRHDKTGIDKKELAWDEIFK
jgi:phosphohistidine swiveling domain-containing protein